MEVLNILEVTIGVIIGLSIFELCMFILNIFKEEKQNLDKEYDQYKEYINSTTVAKATDLNKED